MDKATYNRVAVPGHRRSVTVTFRYQFGLRTLVARNRNLAWKQARERWGEGWIGAPVVSSPESIYRDITGETRTEHGQDFTNDEAKVALARAAAYEGRSHGAHP